MPCKPSPSLTATSSLRQKSGLCLTDPPLHRMSPPAAKDNQHDTPPTRDESTASTSADNGVHSTEKRSDDGQFPESTVSSPGSLPISPDASTEHIRSETLSPLQEPDLGSDASQRRPSSSSGKSTPAEKEKRKRSRVTPDQLVHLERFFAVDRSPTAGRRREISELLGMHERQTQIWFQNRCGDDSTSHRWRSNEFVSLDVLKPSSWMARPKAVQRPLSPTLHQSCFLVTKQNCTTSSTKTNVSTLHDFQLNISVGFTLSQPSPLSHVLISPSELGDA